MSNLTISIDSSKVLSAGTHFKFTEPSNLVIVQKYLVYTTSGKIDTFQTVQLEKTVLTKSLNDLTPGEQYIIQLVIETASSTLQSNSLSFIATTIPAAFSQSSNFFKVNSITLSSVIFAYCLGT